MGGQVRMKRMRYLVPLLLLFIVVAGCGRQNAAPAPEPNRGPTMDQRADMGQADEAKRIAEETEGVTSAYAVVTGPSMLMVGLFLEEGMSDERATQIEDELADKIRDELDGVNRVMVTSNPDIAQRIREIGRGVEEGRPISEFADETEDIMERLTPQM